MTIEAVDTRARGLRGRTQVDAVGFADRLRRLDWLLLAAHIAVVAYGLWAIDGITMHDVGGSAMPRQAVYAIAGALVFAVTIMIDPARYQILRRPIYFGTLAVMIFVLAAGAATRGSKRWIDVGFFTFQPSEFGKVVFVLALAGFVAERARSLQTSAAPLALIGYGVGPIVLVFLQPDIGTALVYSAALAAVLFIAGVRWLHLGLLAGVATIVALAVLWLLPAAGVNVLKPYQTARLTGFTHPDNDPRGATYNVTQSITAVGAGGLRGRGPQGATQTRLNYLPEHATDFAFASLSEERGFFGASILLLLYLLVVWRALKIVASARDLYCAVAAGAIAFMFLFQVFVNSAMTMGIAPITGIPLPFVSVGGSSMITNFLALGVLQAIYMRRPLRRRVRPMSLNPLSVLKVARELKRGSGNVRPLGVAGARELVPILARELREGGRADAVVEQQTTNIAALIWVGEPDERKLHEAVRAKVPIIAVTDAPSFPYVLAEDLVRVPRGQGFPLDAIATALAARLDEQGALLAGRLPAVRAAVCRHLISKYSKKNALVGAAVFIPGVDMPVLTLNQIRLVLWIAVAYGEDVDRARAAELLGVVGAGFGFRAVARELLDLVPVAGWAVKGAVAYTGTRAVGEAAVRYFETRA